MIGITQSINEYNIKKALVKSDNKIQECYDKFCLNETMNISGKDQTKPWMNRLNKNNIQKRENNYKLFKQRLISEREYKFFHKLVNSQIRITKITTKEYSMKIKSILEKLFML